MTVAYLINSHRKTVFGLYCEMNQDETSRDCKTHEGNQKFVHNVDGKLKKLLMRSRHRCQDKIKTYLGDTVSSKDIS